MNTTLHIHLALLGLIATSGCSYLAPNDESGETGQVMIEEGPPEVESPPNWVCRERAPIATFPGYEESIQDREICYYSPAGNETPIGWPGKPHWDGLYDAMQWLSGFESAEGDSHPTYTWFDPNENDPFVLHRSSFAHPDLPENQYEFRSGLVGNFGLWIGGVPDSGHRPPIVTASFIDVTNLDIPTIWGHPFYEGRYNVYGSPCSLTRPAGSAVSYGWPLGMVESTHNPHADCRAYVSYYGISEAHPLYPMYTQSEDAIETAIDDAQCLANGEDQNGVFQGGYKVSEGAPSAAVRQGLIWINWGEFWEDFVMWVQQEHPEVHSLLVAMDALQDLGWGSWPVDPIYPYNSFSHTGECAFRVTLAWWFDGVRTELGCPTGMIAVMPDITDGIIEDMAEIGYRHEGYCTYPHQTPPPPSVGDTGVPQIQVGLLGNGFTGARYVDLSRTTADDLTAWSRGVSIKETWQGLSVASTDRVGSALLSALGIPEGSILVGLNRLVFSADAASGEPGASAAEAAIEVDRTVSVGGLLFILVDAPDGTRIHRYVVPHAGAPVEASEVR